MRKWLIVGIVLLGFLLRTLSISDHPVGFTPDEASFGYDAYSILKTGKDQWGHTLPLVLKSFGDDKLPLYAYLDIPFVALLGLNETAVRLPNALLGTFAIVITFLLVRALFKREDVALLAAFLLAISPWHVMLSRGAFEANLSTFLLPLGVLFFLAGIKKKKYLILSAIVFGLNLFSYHTARLLTPLIVGFLLWQNWKELKKNLYVFSTVFVLFLIPAIYFYLMGGGRVASSGIFDLGFASDRYLAQVVGEPNLVAKIFYNKPIYVFRQFLSNYLSYFSPQFLFTNGPAEGTYGMVPGIGVLYLVELFFLVGFILNTVRNGLTKETKLIVFWILISILPAALTKGPGYAANRTAFVLPALQIILAIGGLFIYNKFKTKSLKRIVMVGYFFFLLLNFTFVAERYWVGETVNQAPSMVYGVKEIIKSLGNIDKSTNMSKVIFSKSISEPQIYVAFYTKMNPEEFQNNTKNWSLVNGWVDQMDKYSLGNYTFKSIDRIVDLKTFCGFVVGKPSEFPEDTTAQKIMYPNNSEAYWIVDRNCTSQK